MNLSKASIILLLFILLGICLRFYNLNWGAPFYFHPDERNIAAAITQLHFPDQLNPHFFAYGSFPLYSIYGLGIACNIFLYSIGTYSSETLTNVSFETAIIASRLYSAFFSLLIIILIYKTIQFLANQQTAYVGVILATVSTGFIQFAHFGTFEMWLSFFSLLLFYLLLLYLKTKKNRYFLLASVIAGLLMAIKISSFIFLFFPPLCLLLVRKNPMHYVVHLVLFIFTSFSVYMITSPYVFLDFSSFLSSMNYESSVSLGTLPVFYTQEFFNTLPIFYQFRFIYPFLLNPFFTLAFIPAFFYILYITIKNKNSALALLVIFYLSLFLSQAFLFTKWTRYIVPTLPFIYIILALGLNKTVTYLSEKLHRKPYVFLFGIFLISSLFGISYFITAYVRQDTRIHASLWAEQHIPQDALIVSEVFELGITPFNQYFPHITLFDFYHLETDYQKTEELQRILETHEYIILPSQRILKTRLLQPQRYPQGYDFYTTVFSEKHYKKVYETPCDIFCKITYMNNPVFAFEQTASVFDRPTVFIFEKIKTHMSKVKTETQN